MCIRDRYRATVSDDIGRHKRHCPCLLAVSVTRLLYDMLRSVDDLCHVFNVGDVRDIDVAYVFRAAAIGRDVDFARGERKPADRGSGADGD